MGPFDHFALWQQLSAAALLFGFLSLTLWWLLRRWNRIEQPLLNSSAGSENGVTIRSDAYAPMFRRIAPPSQPAPLAVTPETPRPSLTATTSPATGPVPAPSQAIPFTELASQETMVPAFVSAPPAPAPFRPAAAPAMALNPQRVVKIIPRTGASIGDISAKPVTASIGTRLSVLSLSVVDRPYAKPQLKATEPAAAVAHAVKGSEPDSVRAAAPLRVFSREEGIQNAGVAATRQEKPRSPVFRDLPSGALPKAGPDFGAAAVTPLTPRPTTAQIISGRAGESDTLSRFAAQMKQAGSDAPPRAATTPIKPLVPAPRPMTATVPIVSPRVVGSSNPVAAAGPNTVQLTIGFEIASLQLTPALKLGAVQIRPTSNIVSVQLDATSQATLQRLLAGGVAPGSTPAFEIESLQLTSGGKIALITLAPKK